MKGDFTCDLCGKVLKGRQAIRVHLNYQHVNPDLCCDLCPKTFKQMVHLRAHMNRYHMVDKPYHCNICKFKTWDQSYLRRHKKKHEKVPQPNASCEICKKKMQKRSLACHMKFVHGKRKWPVGMSPEKLSGALKSFELKLLSSFYFIFFRYV